MLTEKSVGKVSETLWVALSLTTRFASASRLHWVPTRTSGVNSPVGLVRFLVMSYLVDPASSHMLVSKTKPCKYKYKQSYRETADGSLKQLSFI